MRDKVIQKGKWIFDEKVADAFDDMLSRSIPNFNDLRSLITSISSKLVNIFEPNSLTQVHGFDWFKGMQPNPASDGKSIIPNEGKETYDRILKMRKLQKLDNILLVNDIDLTKDIAKYFSKYPHLRFKLLFFDVGLYEVVKESLPFFWERLVKGGHLILDQYNFEIAPGETKAVSEILGDVKIQTYPFNWMPTSFIVK